MTNSEKKQSAANIERDLIADARNESAWEEPIRVQPATSPRSDFKNVSAGEVVNEQRADPEFQVIGEMAVWFANLELYLELAIWQLVASGDEQRGQLMQAVTAEMSFDRKVRAFSSLFRLRFPDEAEDPELVAIVKELFIAQDERNAILHSGWSYSGDERLLTRMKASAKAKRGLTRRMYVMPSGRLAAIRDHIGEVGQRFARFAMERVQERVATAG